mmetsp:Transcript_102502/g.313426  ORF Transcript_102502/g.313426 Transcript_102502/m.313426 type:complete len:97 (-) Transcript_102502:1277-1567(-)
MALQKFVGRPVDKACLQHRWLDREFGAEELDLQRGQTYKLKQPINIGGCKVDRYEVVTKKKSSSAPILLRFRGTGGASKQYFSRRRTCRWSMLLCR